MTMGTLSSRVLKHHTVLMEPKYHHVAKLNNVWLCLKGCRELVKKLDGVGGGSCALGLVLEGSLKTGFLDGGEEGLGNVLLFWGLGKATDGTTGLVHVAGQFILNIEPLLLVNVSGE